MKRFEGKVAVVTGGGSGVGRAACVMFAKEGAKSVAVDINLEGAKETAAIIEKAGGQALAIGADVAVAADAERIARQTVERFGQINILFNNAGIAPRGSVVDTTEELWDRVLAVDLKSIFLVSKYVIPVMQKSGGGAIINTGSMCSLHGYPNLAAYTAAKGGVLMLTKQMASEYKKHNIRVTCVCPGQVLSPMTEKVWKDEGRVMTDADKAKMQTPEDIADTVLFFASDAAHMISGEPLVVNGVHSN
jgi:NAD(P)-dependent dehydrogenase (short-subunit alcohol dehydrogenase family)